MSAESFKYSIVDEDKQNQDIREKYKLCCDHWTKDVPYLEVIKMLEVKLFIAEQALKLSQELNANYERIINEQRKDILFIMGHCCEYIGSPDSEKKCYELEYKYERYKDNEIDDVDAFRYTNRVNING